MCHLLETREEQAVFGGDAWVEKLRQDCKISREKTFVLNYGQQRFRKRLAII